MKRWTAVVALLALVAAGRAVSANHNVYLPLVPQTPLMQQVIRNQEYVYCMDTRAAAYPNFASQLQDVTDQYAARVGIRARKLTISFLSTDTEAQKLAKASATGCQVLHVMPDGLTCDGWAAQIFYANWPVTVQYCYRLGYTDWRSAQGHELGHGVLGLHEQYNDSGGTIGCTGRQDTVMDCGSGVRYPTTLDVTRGCAIISTAWCGAQLPPPCGDPCWDGTFWVFSDGHKFKPNAGCGEWYRADGRLEWGGCDTWGGGARWMAIAALWLSRDGGVWNPANGSYINLGVGLLIP